MALNFDCALILVYMCRRTLTKLRNTNIGKFLPIDDSIELHKYVGYGISFLGLVHTVMHYCNMGKLTSNIFEIIYLKTVLLQTAISFQVKICRFLDREKPLWVQGCRMR